MEIEQDSQQSFRSTPVGFDHGRAELGDRRGDRRELTTMGGSRCRSGGGTTLGFGTHERPCR
jgi:hypothetical protein